MSPFIEIMIIILVVQAGNFQYQEPVKKCMSYCSSVILLVVFSQCLPGLWRRHFSSLILMDDKHAYRRFLGLRATEERYVLLTGFFFIVCVFILCLIFSEAFSAACWWRARRISSIISHLKEVGPTFFFAINIVLTHCFACLFRSLFLCPEMEKQAGTFQHQETLEKGTDMYCFAPFLKKIILCLFIVSEVLPFQKSFSWHLL